MFSRSLFTLLCSHLMVSTADALFGYGLIRCQFSTAHDAVYLEQIYFNKVFLGQYNSSSMRFEGYINYTRELAVTLNKNPAFLKQEEKNALKCTSNVASALDGLSKTAVEPYVRLTSAEAEGSRHSHMIVCSVYSFYPRDITVTWLRNGETVTDDVSTTGAMSNGNWLYQIHTHLEYTPRSGQTFTCKVEHASFRKPRLYDWHPMSQSDREKMAVGSAGVVLGSVFLIVGVVYYLCNKTDRQLVPRGS